MFEEEIMKQLEESIMSDRIFEVEATLKIMKQLEKPIMCDSILNENI